MHSKPKAVPKNQTQQLKTANATELVIYYTIQP